MKCRVVLLVASLSLATVGAVSAAPTPPTTPAAPAAPSGGGATAKPRRVIVAGPQEDAIAARVQKELTALGFETIRMGALEGCARSAVVVAAADNGAIAATCSDGDQVGVWISDGKDGLRLRDVVVAREEGERARETTAVRAAEIARATIATRDAEEELAHSDPSGNARADGNDKEKLPPAQWEKFDRAPTKIAPLRPVDRAPRFLASAGMSSLLGVDATVGAFSAVVEVGVLRHIAAAARLEYPVESSTIPNANNIRVAPAFAGAGADFPVSAPSSFIVPRFGGGLGVAWINAVRPAGSNSAGRPMSEGSDTTASPALYGTAGLSMRIVGALRIVVDGFFGTTMSRMVVRNEGSPIVYWGQPFGALSLRMELMFQ